MQRLGVIVGSGLRESGFGAGGRPITVAGVRLHDAEDFLLLQRHGVHRYVRPHEIDHIAHVRALAAAGCDRVLALSSVGSLRADWPVGTTLCPDDFYALHVNDTLHDDGASHTVPGFDLPWRGGVLAAWQEHASTPIVDGGVYVQTRGPRFETRAEVRALARLGDVVGMTIAAECILTREAGIAYTSVCVVDNLANGLASEPLTIEQFRAGVATNQARLLADLAAVLPTLAPER